LNQGWSAALYLATTLRESFSEITTITTEEGLIDERLSVIEEERFRNDVFGGVEDVGFVTSLF
jgi:hypothetical protein